MMLNVRSGRVVGTLALAVALGASPAFGLGATSLEEAKTLSAENEKPILIELGTAW